MTAATGFCLDCGTVGGFLFWLRPGGSFRRNQFTGPLMSYFEKSWGSVGPAFWVYAFVCAFLFSFWLEDGSGDKTENLEEIAGWWRHRAPGDIA